MGMSKSLKWYYDNIDKIDRKKRSDYMKEYRLRNLDKWKTTPEMRERRNAARRVKYANDKNYRDSVKKSVSDWRIGNPDKKKSQRIKKYKITLDDFNRMLAIQEFKCAICGYSDRSIPNFFPVIDHCHETGKVRGLLCMNCNQGIGKFKDNVKFLENAIRYMEEFDGKMADMV